MKLPIPSLKKKETQEYFLALLLRDEKVSAVIIQEVEGRMKVLGQHEETLASPLDELSPDDWLEILDKTISRAEETLPPDIETHKTVFGVQETWIEDKKIKKEYLMKLKRISESLDLQPIGFLVINEALLHLIQAEEGAPVSAIFVEIGKKQVSVSLTRAGKIVESKSAHMQHSLPDTVDTLLKYFTVEVLPARLILYAGDLLQKDTKQAEHLAQQFISFPWSKSLPFLHVPQVSVLSPGFDAKAVVRGAAAQMGFEVLNSMQEGEDIKNYNAVNRQTHGEESDETASHAPLHHEDIDQAAADKAEAEAILAGIERPEGEEEKAHATHGHHGKLSEEKHISDVPSDNFGFVMNEDVSTNPPPVHTTHPHQGHEKPQHSTHSHTEHPTHSSDEHEPPPPHHSVHDTPRDLHHDDEEEEKSEEKGASGIAGILAPLKALSFSGLAGKLRPAAVTLPVFSGPVRKLLFLLPIPILLIIGGMFLYMTRLSATVTITMQPRAVTESADITFSSASDNDFTKNSIAASTVSTKLTGTVSTNATGKKEVGEKAKGTVTLYNNAENRRQIPAGTTISAANGLKFTTEKEISIASASGDIFSGTKPGTEKVNVIADAIGTEYNLPAGAKFAVGNSTTLAGKNDSAFSGGSKKEVTVVAKKDHDKLLADLPKSLSDKAKEALQTEVGGGEKLLPFLTESAVTERKFDKKVDEETKKVTLTGTVTYEALAYKESDLESFARTMLQDEYGESLRFSQGGIQTSLSDEKKDDEESAVAAAVTIQAGLLPDVQTESIRREIAGKSFSEASAALRKLPQVADSKITLTPNIPFLPKKLPKRVANIKVEVALDE